jgi:hypothetical protein
VDVYANAFSTAPEHCWRMVHDPEPRKRGHPIVCPRPIAWRGRYRSPEGKVFTVWSCDEHRSGLESVEGHG